MMKVTIKTSCMVKPAERIMSVQLPLSELDQTGICGHVPTFYFYAKSTDDWNTVLQTLKSSLSSTLVHFYPLAGRLSTLPGGRLELDCNAAGAQFVEAYADNKLADLDSFLPSPIYNQLIPSIDIHNTPHEEIPLLVLQVTRFLCGGFCLGLSMSHVVADGQSAFHFTHEWARVCRGESIESPPYLDRKVLRAGDPPRESLKLAEHAKSDPPPILLDQSGDEPEHEKKTIVEMLKLTRTQVEKLRNQANDGWESETSRGFTRYEVVTAHVWRSACKARNHKPEQPTALTFPIDFRSKMRPPLPRDYFGNAVTNTIATGCSGDIISNPLGFSSSKIRDAIARVNDERVNSVLDFLKSQQDISKYRDLLPRSNGGGFCGNPNLGVTSWLTLPVYGVDFGWGKEVHMSPGTHDTDGDCLIVNGEDGDGSLVVALCLKASHMEDFKKLFYQDIDIE